MTPKNHDLGVMSGHDLGVMSGHKTTTWVLCDSKESRPGGCGVVVRLSGVGSLLLSLSEVHPKCLKSPTLSLIVTLCQVTT